MQRIASSRAFLGRVARSRVVAAAAVAVPCATVRGVFGQGNSTGVPINEEGYEVPKGHKLYNSSSMGSAFKTACGREFDPLIYVELIQAMSDQSWGQAIGRQLREDKDYMEMLRTEGGAARKVDAIFQQGFSSDDEFMSKLRKLLTADPHAALGVCAIQDAYCAIRKKRDEHATNVVASGGVDPMGTAKSRRQFGDQMPNMGGGGQ